MTAVLAVLIGIVLAVLLLRLGGAGAHQADGTLRWWAIGLGVCSVAALAVGLRASARPDDTGFILNILSMAFAAAAILIAATALRRGQRPWPIWVGLVASLAVVLFWLWFAAGYLFTAGN